MSSVNWIKYTFQSSDSDFDRVQSHSDSGSDSDVSYGLAGAEKNNLCVPLEGGLYFDHLLSFMFMNSREVFLLEHTVQRLFFQ